tara:strand:- start:23 stop:661 length:639 start_codon:yes stop_codon:yes gene_type:complete
MNNKYTIEQFEKAKIIEALVFASKEIVLKKNLINFFDDEKEYLILVEIIKSRYGMNSGIEFIVTDETLSFRTKAEVSGKINLERKVKKPLSRASTEVLAIIAYHQPITRAEIEEIRGVSLSRGVIDVLIESNWIRPFGRKRTPGRPVTWATTNIFLDYFGLKSISDLPSYDELKKSGILQKRTFNKISDDINDLIDHEEDNLINNDQKEIFE